MKILIDIEREIWADVKHYATVEDITYSKATEKLLKKALESHGYSYETKQ